MTHQSYLRCSFQLLAILVVGSASVMTLAGADEFRLLEVKRLQTYSESIVTVKFQGPEPSSVTVLSGGSKTINGNEIIIRKGGYEKNMTIRMNFPDATYTMVINALAYPPRVRGQRRVRSVNATQSFLGVSMTLPVVTEYRAGDNATLDIHVTNGGVARDGVVGEELTFKTYVRTEELILVPGARNLLRVSDRTEEEQGGGATVHRVELNTGEEPQGLAIVKAFVQFSPNASVLVQSMQVEKITEFYSTEKGSALANGTLTYFNTIDTYSWRQRIEICDDDLPTCDVTCSIFAREVPASFLMKGLNKKSYWIEELTTKQETAFGVITTLTYTSDDPYIGKYQCIAKAEESSDEVHQLVELKHGKPVRMLPDISAAEMHANQTLEVRCAAYGNPTPELSITADDDPSTPLLERFRSESFPMVVEMGSNARLRYMLNKPSFTSTLTHVTCWASNAYGEPLKIVLPITPAA